MLVFLPMALYFMYLPLGCSAHHSCVLSTNQPRSISCRGSKTKRPNTLCPLLAKSIRLNSDQTHILNSPIFDRIGKTLSPMTKTKSAVQWCSGYHMCLTHTRSPVRNRVEPADLAFLTARAANIFVATISAQVVTLGKAFGT
ncbi:hypothetical protein GGS20DRAFT_529754 [Poronia punctata]|nr:hypothetical protein GGS20DRAFT_529754 [Poronia punctata]